MLAPPQKTCTSLGVPFPKDKFTQWLEAKGMAVRLYQPGGTFGCPPVGWEVAIGYSNLAYRVPEESPETLIIVLIERQKERQGLRSPFADLVRFVTLVGRSGAGIRDIRGHVDAVSWRPEDSLESARIKAFYERHMGTHPVRSNNGREFVGAELAPHVPPLAAHRNRTRKHSPESKWTEKTAGEDGI